MEAQYWVQRVASLWNSPTGNYSYLEIPSTLEISMILGFWDFETEYLMIFSDLRGSVLWCAHRQGNSLEGGEAGLTVYIGTKPVTSFLSTPNFQL